MLDRLLRPVIDPPLNAIGHFLARRGISANQITLAGALVAIAAGGAAASGYFHVCLVLIALNRLLDGLDGAVARATHRSDLGGYLDIVCDYIFYLAIPVGFGLHDPANLPAALVLTASFTLTAVTFLAFAAIAARRKEPSLAPGTKSFFYSVGLAEGTETILAFITMCIAPALFPVTAFVFAGLCALTILQRSFSAYLTFAGRTEQPASSE
jgi:phosphatidylglycerophosphate synthase